MAPATGPERDGGRRSRSAFPGRTTSRRDHPRRNRPDCRRWAPPCRSPPRRHNRRCPRARCASHDYFLRVRLRAPPTAARLRRPRRTPAATTRRGADIDTDLTCLSAWRRPPHTAGPSVQGPILTLRHASAPTRARHATMSGEPTRLRHRLARSRPLPFPTYHAISLLPLVGRRFLSATKLSLRPETRNGRGRVKIHAAHTSDDHRPTTGTAHVEPFCNKGLGNLRSVPTRVAMRPFHEPSRTPRRRPLRRRRRGDFAEVIYTSGGNGWAQDTQKTKQANEDTNTPKA